VIYLCCDRQRRNEVAAHPTLNGIDYMEVLDEDAPAGSPRQRTLLVRLLKPAPALTAGNVRVEGGERFDEIRVEWVVVADNVPAAMVASGAVSGPEAACFGALTQPDHVLVVRTDAAGDYSPYRLRLVTADNDPTPPPSFDPRLASAEFSFKVECEDDFDCKAGHACSPAPRAEPRIDYLARDYASFRRLMLDRMSLLAPDWTERSAADQGVVLVELLAHVGDLLSYEQDAVTTEAYLATARRRISVRRHARLVDYFISDGSNARTWVHLDVSADVLPLGPGQPVVPAHTRLFTELPKVTAATVDDDPRVWGEALLGFETVEPVRALFAAHGRMPFHTWSDRECCLPVGATSATLLGSFPSLEAGMVLVFEEVLGPETGHPGDADTGKRHAVRLTDVTPATDPVDGTAVTEIRWEAGDALPFPLCLSSRTSRAHGSAFVDEVSVARGNIVLADHGLTMADEDLGTVSGPVAAYAPGGGSHRCHRQEPTPVLPHFRPRLASSPVTQAGPYEASGPARDVLKWEARHVLPAIRLTGHVFGVTSAWEPRRDLLASDADHRHFVVEVEDDGAAILRFGNDAQGERPEPGMAFSAAYRVGNGRAGNIGVDSLVHIAIAIPEIRRVRNLTPGQGGRDPESMEAVRQNAPSAFRTQERAVTEADYAEVTERDPGVQQAAASFRWTGSWHTVFLTADRLSGLPVDAEFVEATRRRIERYRMAGYDLEVDPPRPVSVEIEMRVCVHPDHFRSDVRVALQEKLSHRVLPDGTPGVFHPDNFSFAQPVYLSRIYAAAQEVPGVSSVQITMFRRQDEPATEASGSGKLEMGRFEIARLENDPTHPGHGLLHLEMEGGK